jgi:hypothetical protein
MENCDVMLVDIPNALVQSEKSSKGKKNVMIRKRGKSVDMFENLSPELYSEYVVYKNEIKVLYVQVF